MSGERPLRILLVEDDPGDAVLLERALRKAGFTFTLERVQSAEGVSASMGSFAPDIVLSDYSMPGFDGLSALRIVRERDAEVPFIFLSGSIGEERAVEALRSGATDYVIKDRPGRLAPAIRRALAEAAQAAERRRLDRQNKELERGFLQAQKMEAVGRLAGGVAHDFNNMLLAIGGYAQMLEESLSPEDRRRDDVAEIRKAADRAAALTRQLLAFSRKQVMHRRPISLNDTVHGVTRMLERLAGPEVRLELALSGELRTVRADPGQIEQVLMNLAVNGRDAMSGCGTLTIRTANADLDEAFVRAHPGSRPGRYAMLEVTDTGTGFDETVRAHLFEPFFTTKPQGQGTGLGLATVYGIVKQSDGYIEADSALGRGTSFRVYLPAVEGAPEPVDAGPARKAPRGGGERVLIVDDEPAIRGLIQRILAEAGYRAETAASAGEAVAALRREPAPLVVTDLRMPGTSGRGLAAEVASLQPDCRFLFITGQMWSEGGEEPLPETALLLKPFTAQSLLMKVRGALDKRRSGT